MKTIFKKKKKSNNGRNEVCLMCQSHSSFYVKKKKKIKHINNYINIDGPGHFFKLFFPIRTLLYRMTGIIKINTLILTVVI